MTATEAIAISSAMIASATLTCFCDVPLLRVRFVTGIGIQRGNCGRKVCAFSHCEQFLCIVQRPYDK